MSRGHWKHWEREVARRLGGSRFPANTGGPVDVSAPGVACQVKELRVCSLAELERLAVAIDTVARAQVDPVTREPRPVTGIVVVKRSAGRGKETVPLVVLTLDAWTR